MTQTPETLHQAGPLPPGNLPYHVKWQLAADYHRDPTAFMFIRAYSVDQIGERRDLTALFKEHIQGETALAQQRLAYDDLILSNPPGSRTPATKTVIQARGLEYRAATEAQRARTEQAFNAANAFSFEFAMNCLAAIGGTAFRLMETTYEYDHCYLATTVPAKPIPKPVIFAGLTEAQRRNRQQIQHCPPRDYTVETTLVRLASVQDWLGLLMRLDAIARMGR